MRIPAAQLAKRVDGVSGSEFGLRLTDPNTSVVGDVVGRIEAFRIRRHSGCRLERILWRNQPPDLVEVQSPEREQANVDMAGMGWIE